MLLLEKFLCKHMRTEIVSVILGLFYFQIRRASNMCRKSNHPLLMNHIFASELILCRHC